METLPESRSPQEEGHGQAGDVDPTQAVGCSSAFTSRRHY